MAESWRKRATVAQQAKFKSFKPRRERGCQTRGQRAQSAACQGAERVGASRARGTGRGEEKGKRKRKSERSEDGCGKMADAVGAAEMLMQSCLALTVPACRCAGVPCFFSPLGALPGHGRHGYGSSSCPAWWVPMPASPFLRCGCLCPRPLRGSECVTSPASLAVACCIPFSCCRVPVSSFLLAPATATLL